MYCPGLGLVSGLSDLEKLEQLGLVQRVHQTRVARPSSGPGMATNTCWFAKNCGKAVLFEGDQLDPLFNSISKTTGFQIESHWLQVFGLCKACRSDS